MVSCILKDNVLQTTLRTSLSSVTSAVDIESMPAREVNEETFSEKRAPIYHLYFLSSLVIDCLSFFSETLNLFPETFMILFLY